MKTEYYHSAELSDLGRKRKNNEDACIRIPEHGVFCVADGMGGVVGGDLASEAITTSIQDTFTKHPPGEQEGLASRIALFRSAVNQASKWIKNFADERVIGQMGSTVVALIFYPNNPTRAVALHAGDSRLNRYRGGELKVLTADHSAAAALAAKLGRDPATLPAKYQNELLRAVGLTECVELELTPVEVQSGDLFLLCSDGLTRMVPNEGIANILKRASQEPLDAVAKALIDAANQGGGKDNITAVLVKIGDISRLPLLPELDLQEEPKTLAGGETLEADEAHSPATPSAPHAVPDTAEALQGDTPHTDDNTPHDPAPPPAARAPAPVAASRESADTPSAKAAPSQPKVEPPVPTPAKAAAPESKPQPPTSTAPQPQAAQPQPARPQATQKQAVQASSRKGIWIAGAAVVVVGVAALLFFGTLHMLFFGTLHTSTLKPSAPEVAVTPTPEPASAATETKAATPRPPPAVPVQADAQAQQKAAEFQKALQTAQAALASRDYGNATTWAAAALKVMPDNAEAVKTSRDAQAALAAAAAAQVAEQNYQAELKAAQAALDKQDFAGAISKADGALALKPGSPEATRLKQTAQAKLEELKLAQERGQRFQKMLQAAKSAFDQQDFIGAMVRASEALGLKPGDAAAAQLKAQAVEAQDLAAAQARFSQADYAQAQTLCAKHADGAAFKELTARIASEQQALADATGRFASGDYGFVAGLKAQSYAGKKPFTDLLAKATAEAQALAELQGLKQTNNWQAVTAKLAEPAASGFAAKPPFRALAESAQSFVAQARGAEALDRLDTEFEKMLVWFNIVRPTSPYLRLPEARKETRHDGEIGAQREYYLGRVTVLENEFKKGGWLNQRDRAKYLGKLRDEIKHRE
jgi:protein phosphatase